MAINTSRQRVVTSPFPALSELFEVSWQLLVSRLLRFFLFALTSFAFYTIFYIIIFVIGGITLFNLLHPLFITHGNFDIVKTLPSLISTGSILFIIFFIGAILLSALSTSWFLLSIGEGKDIPFSIVFNKGFSYVLPLVGVSLLLILINVGALFFFILPVILFSIFFAFSHFEVVYDQQRGTNALKRSYLIITSHFGDIFVRMFILWLIYVAFALLPQLFKNSILYAEISWILVIFEVLLGWFSICYWYTIYQQAKERTELSKSVSLTWVWIVALLGWIIFILITIGVISAANTFIRSGNFNKMLQTLGTYSKSKHNNNYNFPTNAPQYQYRYNSNTPSTD